MKKYKIAFSGTYDIDNFGDHLFPIIFKNFLRKKNIDFEADLYSPFETIEGFGLNNKIHSLKRLNTNEYDAIIVGGGEIIHTSCFKHKNHNSEYVNYPIFETWMIPSVFNNNSTKIIWNNPGCPFEFKKYEENMICKIVNNIDYLSVRNDFSKNIIEKYASNVHKSFDTAFLLPEIWSKNDLKNLIGNKYIVYHCHRFMGDDYYQESLKVLLDLSNHYQIVLVPLAYTNEDDEMAKKLYEDSHHIFTLITNQLTIKEIVSLFAHCHLYIGVSYHGAIVSYSYGNKIIGYDYFSNKKTIDLFHDLQLDDNYINQCGVLSKTVQYVLNNEQNNDNYPDIIKNLYKHFDNIVDVLESPKRKEVSFEFNNSDLSDLFTELSLYCQEIEHYKYDANYNLLNWQKCSNELIEMYNSYKRL